MTTHPTPMAPAARRLLRMACACLLAGPAWAAAAGPTVLAQADTAAPAGASTRANDVRTLGPMVAFDGVYIPALAQSSSASQKPEAAPAAAAAMARLQKEWPALRTAMAGAFGASAPEGWAGALQQVDQQISLAARATAASQWHDVHEALEEVRLALMRVRVAARLGYFVDRLTAYHEPMEVIALTGAQLKPADLDAAKRADLRKAYSEASTLWKGIRSATVNPAVYALDARRLQQLQQGLADEDTALRNLGQALDGGDPAAILRAAAAVKPPFARVFTAFGQPQ